MERSRIKSFLLSWLRPLSFTLLAITLACLLRLWPLGSLEQRIPWVTFYPAVMVAALFGGIGAGLLGATLACLIVTYLWFWFTPLPFIQTSADWLGMAVFFINCVFISAIAEGTRRARRHARRSQEQAEAANRAKSVFLANMSHELRTPLNAVLGFSRLMKNDAQLTSLQSSRLDIIIQSGEHLLNLINNILDISKIESGRVELEESRTDLPSLVREVFTLMSVRATEKRLDFTLELDPDLPRFVLVDAGKLRQVLLNLLGNAIKYTPSGEVLLRARRLQPENSQRVWGHFEVQDSGPGIRSEDRQRIFQPFVQLDNQSQAERGSGLGLAISRQNMELMGGKIELGDAPGRGTLVFFEIPLTIIAGEHPEENPSGSRVVGLEPGQPRYRLLVTDDMPESRLLLRQLLEPFGFEMQEAANGQEAVQIFESWNPDLIWMDMRMPVVDGQEATRLIRAHPGGKRVKIIALTAHALESEREEILAAGCDDFIRKPYRDAEIFQTLARHLGVVFLYEEQKAAQQGQLCQPDAQRLRALPQDLLHDLAQAAERLDGSLCRAVIEKVNGLDHEQANCLAGMVDKLQYGELLKILDLLLEKDGAHG
jgi:signal transduction histidine kinase/DNA-binding NarL/FixJ family response regulator